MISLKCNIYSLPITIWGRLFYLVRPTKSSMAKRNIEKVFSKTLSSKEQRHLRLAYYSHMMRCMKEIFLYSFLPKRYLRERIVLRGMEHYYQAQTQKKGIIVLTGHLGNWEFGPLFFPGLIEEQETHYYCIRKSLRFGFLNRIFWNRYIKAGFRIINKRDALRQVHMAIKNGHVVFFPFDLKPPNCKKTHVIANFLGQPSPTYPSAAHAVAKLDCIVLSSTYYRLENKQHVLEFYPEIPQSVAPNRKEACLENTQNFNQRLEEMLLAHPEQWLWSYKRW